MWILRARRLLHLMLACVLGGRCPGCAAPTLQPLCDHCMTELCAIAPAPHAALRDEGVAGRLVRLAKHGRWRAGADVFADLLIDRLGGSAAVARRIELVTWIPADRSRRRKRGGHLPEQVARSLAHSCGLPARSLLVRERSRAQRGLDEYARASNVRGMFRLAVAVRRRSAPATLVIDDVCTTGATLNEACRVLTGGGVRAVPYAIAGVTRTFGHRSAREGEDVGVEPQVCAACDEKPHSARKFGSRIVVRMPMGREPTTKANLYS